MDDQTLQPDAVETEDQEEIIELWPQREHQLMRLDKYVASQLPDLSRTYLQQLITEGRLLVDGQVRRAAFKMTPGQVVTLSLPPTEDFELEAQDIPLDIIFEDDDILLINKPAAMVVHPAPGHPRDTLVNAVLHHAPSISIQGSNRPGIIHRLDKDTSGVMVIAKSNRAQMSLAEQWQERSVIKRYTTLVAGVVEEDSATIDAPIGRNTVNRQQMTTTRSGREAITHFTVVERFEDTTLLDVQIETGRTHQIRVHLAFIGFPVVGDALYGNKVSARIAERLGVERQFLHASSLGIRVPSSNEHRTFDAPLPAEMAEVLEHLRSDGPAE
ncbi:MAG TPA: RluA family pseudouridine synthase [Thermomicrobiales bacterium]|nr:RluA family pseudouridine synthase [Thermomicrobiales bacterium]